MVDDDGVREILDYLDFTENQTAAYLAVLNAGEVTMAGLADRTDLSRPGAYKVAEQLAGRDLVSIDDYDRPTTVRPLRYERVSDAYEPKIDVLKAAIEERTGPSSTFGPVEFCRSPSAIRRRLSRLLSAADSEILLAYPAQIPEELTDALRDAVARGVLVLVVTDGEAETPPSTAAHVHRHSEGLHRLRAVVDSDVAVSGGQSVASAASTTGGATFISENNTVHDFLHLYIDRLWLESEQVASLDPAAPPCLYYSFKNAVLDAALHCRADRDIRLETSAVDLETDEQTTLEGRITGTNQCLVDPTTHEYRLQNAISVQTDAGVVDVGGVHAGRTDFAARPPVRLVESPDDG